MLLFKSDPTAHIDRWYLVVVQPTLLDQAAVICAWGSRKTSYQRTHIIPAATAAEAKIIAAQIIRKKIRRGYTCWRANNQEADTC